MGTLKDIAEYAGVSQVTVSRIMNDKAKGEVSPAVISRVREAVELLGYTPRGGGRKSKSAENSVSRLIILLPEAGYFENNDYLPQMKMKLHGGIMRAAEKLGVTPDFRGCLIANQYPAWDTVLDITPADRILGFGAEIIPVLYELSRRGCRCVLTGDDNYWMTFYQPQLRHIARFIVNRSASVISLSKILYRHGCRRIASVAFSQYMYEPGYRRTMGYESAMSLLNLNYRRIIPVPANPQEMIAPVRKAYDEEPFDGLLFSAIDKMSVNLPLNDIFGLPESVKIAATCPLEYFSGDNVPFAAVESLTEKIAYEAVMYLYCPEFKPVARKYVPTVIVNEPRNHGIIQQ